VLIVVLLLLALFAVLGVSFVLYADAAAKAAEAARDAEALNPTAPPDINPDQLLSFFLDQLLFDTDNQNGVGSALRGHSLSRLMYGYNDSTGVNFLPFNGVGRLHGSTAPPSLGGADDYQLINYTYFAGDGFVRDPERQSFRTTPLDPYGLANAYFGFNVSYTYPDLNNMFLAAVNANGQVLMPSFHRPYAAFGPLDPTNPNWFVRSTANPALKYMVLRPRPIDQLLPGENWPPARRYFPAPEDTGGDVKNLVGPAGGNDSIWLDLDFPIVTLPDGRKFKPLFAPLIIDLDGRVNLNVHGNVRGQNSTHTSNQGWGPWTVNLSTVLSGSATEWTQLFQGRTAPQVAGRYGGPNGNPGPGPGQMTQLPFPPPFYSLIDFDGCNDDGTPTDKLPTTGAAPYGAFPAFPKGYGNSSPGELTNHPGLYNPFQPAGRNRLIPIPELEALLRWDEGATAGLSSDLMRLCPANFNNPSDPSGSARRRRLVTLHSFDVDRPGVTPCIWPSTTPPSPTNGLQLPTGQIYPTTLLSTFPMPPNATASGNGTTPTEFGMADWRAITASLGRLDLNRPLPDYPVPKNGKIDYDLATFMAAQTARQQLARDIFTVLLKVTTGLTDPSSVPTTPPEPYNAVRWLAQLAVNIVDYVDKDDYMTPFFWNPANPKEVVLGTELPRVVINEAYVEFSKPQNVSDPTVKQYDVNVWLEVYNPLSAGSTVFNGPDVTLSSSGVSKIYQCFLCQPYKSTDTDIYLRRFDNVWGSPQPYGSSQDMDLVYKQSLPSGPSCIVDFSSASQQTIPASTYYTLGPGQLPSSRNDGPTPTYVVPSALHYQVQVPVPSSGPMPPPPAPLVLLQRLAYPTLPPQNNPQQTLYNPYVTIDYSNHIDAGSGIALRSANRNDQPINGRQSDGRGVPYIGFPTATTLQTGGNANWPQHTMGAVNSQVPNPANFDWLIHLDRPLVSPMELVHVSGQKPSELTQRFGNTDAGLGKFSQRAPWFDEDLIGETTPKSHLLYRFLEFVEARSRAAGFAAAATVSQNAVPPPSAPGQLRQNVVVHPASMSFLTASGVPVMIHAGSVLVIDSGANQENVVVKAAPPGRASHFIADFYKHHAAGFSITLTETANRVPGKININTIWDPETLLALCDPQAANQFTAADVNNAFGTFFQLRMRGDRSAGISAGQFSKNDTPFWGLGFGTYAPTDTQFPSRPADPMVSPLDMQQLPYCGVENTVFRAMTPTGKYNRLFEVPYAAPDPNPPPSVLTARRNSQPYTRYDVFQKVFNNLTTRSNVFAAWVTVGFFEVIDDTSRPPKLGAELGRSENRNVRHRMFAVLDRTNLVAPVRDTQPIAGIPATVTWLTTGVHPANTLQAVSLEAVQGDSTVPISPPTPALSWGLHWTITTGTSLVLDVGTSSEETVHVQGVEGSTIVARFVKSHTAGASVALPINLVPGNPGPQSGFDPRTNPALVPYYTIIN
jgi:hypothetical protein